MKYDANDHADALFDSTYLRWFHLNNSPALVEIVAVRKRVTLTLPGGREARKPVIQLKQVNGKIDTEKQEHGGDIHPLVLNQTSKTGIMDVCGSKPSEWVGQQVVLYQAEDKLRGELVPCIRIRKPKGKGE